MMVFHNDLYYIEKVQAGDTKAFADLVNKHKVRVFSVAFQIVRNREDAEEVAQDAFLKAFNAIPQFRGESKFSSWMYRIVYNTAISKVRRKPMFFSSINEDEINNFTLDDIFENLDKRDEVQQKRLVNDLMNQLEPDERGLIALYYYDDKSVDDISKITGLSDSNVKVKMFRIRKKMHNIFQQLLSGELKEIYS